MAGKRKALLAVGGLASAAGMPPLGNVLGAGNIYATVDPDEISVQQAGETVSAPNPNRSPELRERLQDDRASAAWEALQAGIKAAVFGQAEFTAVHALDARQTVFVGKFQQGKETLQLSVFAVGARDRLRVRAVQVAGNHPIGYLDVYGTDPRQTGQLDRCLEGFLALAGESVVV